MTRTNTQWSAKTLVNKMEKGKVNFDNAVQRGLVWDKDRKSLLIHSMLYGYVVPAMYFVKDKGIFDSLDGKQRSNAISEFFNGEFALTENTPPIIDETIEVEEGDDPIMFEIAGMKYEDLPEWAQEHLNDYSLTIYCLEDIDESEIKEMFRRLNNGKPLTAVELTRVNTPCLIDFQQLASHVAIQSVVTDAAKKRFTDENIAMQLYHMATEEKPDFSTKSFREWARNVRVDDRIMENLNAALDAYYEFYNSLDATEEKKIIRSIKTRTHFVSCAYYCYLALQEEKTQDEINNALRDFFSGKPTTSEEYNSTVGSGSAKPTAVQTRQRIIQELAGVEISMDDNMEDEIEPEVAAVEESEESTVPFIERVMDDVEQIVAETEVPDDEFDGNNEQLMIDK